ncbi:MAG: tetratricopeptide repeat protein [Myxococcota bacterium]
MLRGLATVVALALVATSARAADPDRSKQLAQQSIDLLEQGDLGGAEAKAQQALEADRTNPDANTAMGRLKLLRGDLPAALNAANVALGKDKTHAGALILLVRVQAIQEVPDSAVTKLGELANTYRDNVGVQLAYGEAQLAAKKWDGAAAAATRVLKLQETSVAAMKVLARSYLGLERPVTAESVLARALELERDPEALALLAGIRYHDKQLVEARVLLEEAVGKRPGYVEALNALGCIYVAVQNWESANDVLQRAIALAPNFYEAWLDIGSAQRGAGQFEAAEQSWKKVLALQPKVADAYYNLGVLYLENEMPKRDRIQQLTDAVNAFNAYKRGGGQDAQSDKYVDEARLLIKQETERRNEELKGPPKDGGGGDNK